jgi:DnaK suppressor protein
MRPSRYRHGFSVHTEPRTRTTPATRGSTEAVPLTGVQCAELRSALEATRDRLLHLRDERRGRTDAAPVDGGDVADVAEGVIEDRFRESLEEHDRTLLEDVLHALTKVGAGTYGVSELSGRPIPFARLRAVPWARYDCDEAERLERTARPRRRAASA